MSSEESSTESSPEAPPTPEEVLQTSLERKYNTLNLLRMSAVKAIKRALAWEQSTVERQADADHATAYGGDSSTATPATDSVTDDMENMVGGNQTVNNNYPAKETAKTNGVGTLGAVAVGAAVLAGGAGLGAMAVDYFGDDTPTVVVADTDTDSITDLDFID